MNEQLTTDSTNESEVCFESVTDYGFGDLHVLSDIKESSIGRVIVGVDNNFVIENNKNSIYYSCLILYTVYSFTTDQVWHILFHIKLWNKYIFRL